MDRRVISKLYEVDPQFRDVYDNLYGVRKSLDAADVHIDQPVTAKSNKRNKHLAQAGLAATGVAAIGGGHAIHATVRNFKNDKKDLAAGTYEAGPVLRKLKLTPKKAVIAGTAGWIGLHATELAADALAARAQTKVLRNSTPAPPKTSTAVAKAFSLKPINAADARPKMPSLTARKRPGNTSVGKGLFRNTKTVVANAAEASGHATKAAADAAEMTGKAKKLIPSRKATLALAGTGIAATGAANYGATYAGTKQGTRAGMIPKAPKPAKPVKDKVIGKSFALNAEISKLDEDKRQVFGWASVSEIDGVAVLDLQGDYMPIEEVEKSAYRFVLESRVGGDQHARVAKSATSPKHTSDLIESMVFTDEKVKAMHLPEDFPRGWWIGMQVHDEQNWQDIKSGKRTGFSVHGTGRREDVLV